jgi:hypothetical protein
MRVILIIILHLLELMEVTMSLHAPFTLLDFDIGNSSASDRSHDPIPFGFPLIGSRIRGGGALERRVAAVVKPVEEQAVACCGSD